MERNATTTNNVNAAKPLKTINSSSALNAANNSSNSNNNNNNNAANRINYDLLLKSVKTIQSHWRGYAIRKLYRDLRLDMATKAMQFGYFCEQVCFV